ncbi:MAG: hypothetical protein FWG88_08655 [Oscillospiraceae bacterium]|nr:hypothetical protein [Oscillospiraceae bacterium]
MQIKLFDGTNKKIEEEVNEFIKQEDIRVTRIEIKTTVDGTVIMVVYEDVASSPVKGFTL